ncbi:PE domain-containing protein, partial [Mycobacterium asiaticum]|uniref:PE domain-containing protein n=1 Tax=Mycobacterium asiaticum TaxID=1790 RepID=UPI0009C17C77
MSYVVTAPDFLVCAASDLSALGTAVDAANRAAAHSVTSLLTAGADEVSTRIADLFSAHGRAYQAVSAQAAQYGERLVRTLTANADAYLGTEIVNAAQPPPAAGVRLTVGGAGPLYAPRLLTELPALGQIALQGISAPWSASVLQAYHLLNPLVGENWFPDSLAQVVNYPASMGIFSGSPLAPTVNQAVAMGRLTLDQMITSAVAGSGGAPVHIAGLSMGSLVVNRELAYLASSPSAPPPDALQFALFSSPELGLAATYLPTGMTVP